MSSKKLIHFLNLLSLFLFAVCQYSKGGPLGSFFTAIDKIHLKYYVLLVTVGLELIYIVFKKIRFKFDESFNLAYMFSFIALLTITLAKQSVNGLFVNSYVQFLYILVPFVFFFLYRMIFDDYDEVLKMSFVFLIISFVLSIDVAKLASIKNFSFSDSYSPFEGSISFLFPFFCLLFGYKKNYKLMLLSLVLCILTLKRLAVVECVLFSLCSFPLSKEKHKNGITKFLFFVSAISLLVAPLVMTNFYEGSFSGVIYELTGKDLSLFTMRRSDMISFALSNKNLIVHGYGDLDYFMSANFTLFGQQTGDLLSIHCDVLKLFIECGYLGYLAFFGGILYICKKNPFTLLLFLGLLVQELFNHLLGVGFVDYWIYFFFVVSVLKKESKELLLHKSVQSHVIIEEVSLQ